MKGKKWYLLTAMLIALLATMGLSACGTSSEGTEEGTSEFSLDEFTFDETANPPVTKNVVYVKGSWEEMGLQYGQQAKDSVQRDVATGMGSAIDQHGSYEKVQGVLGNYEKVIAQRAPELLELWKGMAKGAEVEYEHVLMSQISYNPEENYCSTVSIWGDKTKSGGLISGVNSDGSGYGSYYTPAVVAFPEKGNSFISYSGFTSNGFLNEKGMVVMASQGQESGEGDIGYGIPPCAGAFHLAWSCDTATQAKDAYIQEKLGPGSGENLHVSDNTGNAYVVEHTNARDMVRTANDYGTGNYTIATNGFLLEDMWSSLHQGDEFWDDCLPRYWTEEKIINDNSGKNTIDTLNDAIGCNSYYVDKNWMSDVWDKEQFVGYKEIKHGIWKKDVWDISENYTGFWTPENREAGTKCIMRGIMDVQNMNYYVMNGCRDTNVSLLPEGTGNFWRLNLGKDFTEITKKAKEYAQKQIYLGSRDIDRAMKKGSDVEDREKDSKEAKTLLLEGIAYEDKAKCTADENESYLYMAKAASCYCRAQCYGQKAQNDPHKLIRQGEAYSVY